MKILFVADQFVPPVDDGSTAVYLSWLKSLSSLGDVYAILFELRGKPTAETHAFLRSVCRDYLILPGRTQPPVLKAARALGRFVNESLFAPRAIEELGREPIKAAASRFIAEHQPDVALISKLECVYLLGTEVLAGLKIPKLLDLHDDFVRRETLTREVLDDLLKTFPSLAKDDDFRLKRMRCLLSRHNEVRARRQERRLLGMFDRILISSHEEYQAYAASEELEGRCAYAPWPIEIEVKADERRVVPEYDAGIIASGNEFNLEGLVFFVRDVLPLIRRRRPGFRLLIAGNILDTFLKTGLPTEGLILRGPVEDISEFYSSIKVCLVPLLNGTGVSLKTLEGIHYRLPVVATNKGVRGLSLQGLPNLYLANTPESIAEVLLSLLDDRLDDAAVAAARSQASSTNRARTFTQICRDIGVGSESVRVSPAAAIEAALDAC